MRPLFKLISLVLISLLLITVVHDGSAQVKKKTSRSLRDSLREKVLERTSLMRSFKRTDDASLDDLLGRIEDYTSLYIQTNSDLSKGFDTLDISQRLPTLEKRMALMKTTIDNSGTLGYLVTIRTMVDHITDQLNSWEDKLTRYSNQLDSIHGDIVKFKKDSVVHSAPEDSTLQDKYILQVQELEVKWQKLDSCSKKSIIKIGLLQNRISSLTILMIDLNDKVDIKIQKFTVNAINNENGFIWDMHPQKYATGSAIDQTYNLNSRLYKYFVTGKANYWSHLGCVLLLVVFFAWIFNSKRKIARLKKSDATATFSQTHYIVKHPFASSLAVLSILAPYLYDHPAEIFTQTMLLISMVCTGVLIKHNWPKPLFNYWLVLLVLTLLFTVSDLMLAVTYADRILLLLLSAVAIYTSFSILKYLKATPGNYPPFMEIIVKIFIALNGISVLLNIAGRFSLAKIMGTMAVFNLCLGMGMYLFVQILMESLFLQLEANKSADNQNQTSYIDFKVLQKKFKDVVIKVAAILWLIALTKNLYIDDYLYDQVGDFLNHPYKFSSTAFTLGSVLIFIIVIWISGLVARVISYFYDFAGQQTKLTPHAKKTRSSILLIRLTIFVIGFFVAITAAGIPMDRVTIIIGALGVGIGFGLQNIVNNLVSGVILAFEKPVQVGDIIEVSGKSGVITEIGIRSSKIDCGDGSQLIVPNGDLISQHVINWTLTNNNRQVEFVVGVAYGSDVSKVEGILNAVVNNHEDIMKSPAPAVYLHNFGESSIDFKLSFWAAEIGKWTALKSNVLSEIYMQFAKEGIEIPHPKRDIQVYFPDGSLAKPNEAPTKNPPDQDH
ncbi:mechanosensitive ion channel family protein [Mucilaginibacter paludis]|uniref:MscS Mechanosensitive ion channel n=1 Tax=Mucilaginibacter paludis DSM 18603 TaxID=714943 RepID=H1Y3C8_9SPHI|nr:mechanosensitive ion channel domain-containing protein [Mucilaginibacter paludis]EHQ29283.1 MscS Mechanosensitive ion channel [Mucilaginibacter paludis DSM 18603]